MDVIYKYTLTYGEQLIWIPNNAKVLSAGIQDGMVVIWVQQNVNEPSGNRVIWVLFTGESLNFVNDMNPPKFIDSVQTAGLVYHIFAKDSNE